MKNNNIILSMIIFSIICLALGLILLNSRTVNLNKQIIVLSQELDTVTNAHMLMLKELYGPRGTYDSPQ